MCDYYAEKAAEFLGDEQIDTDAAGRFVAHQPLGPVLAVMPWNFPFWQVFRFAAPAIAAGNVGVLKHASNVTLCAKATEETFDVTGLPKGVFTTLLISSEQVASWSRVIPARLSAVSSAPDTVGSCRGTECESS